MGSPSKKMKLKLLLISILLIGLITAEQELEKNDNEIAVTAVDQSQEKATDFFWLFRRRRRRHHHRRRHHNPCKGWINNYNRCNGNYRRTIATCNRNYRAKVVYRNKLHSQLINLRKQLAGWNKKVKKCKRSCNGGGWCGIRRRRFVRRRRFIRRRRFVVRRRRGWGQRRC